jgi:hypothetical protein
MARLFGGRAGRGSKSRIRDGFERAMKEDEMDELVKWLNRQAEVYYCGKSRAAAAEITRLRSAVRELREALEPFKEAADQLDDDFRDVSDIWEHSSAMSITGGDLKRARSVYLSTSSILDKDSAGSKT